MPRLACFASQADMEAPSQTSRSDHPVSSGELLPLVYDELRCLARQRLAGERPGQTLQPTALVHEAYLRLTKANGAPRWDSDRHFFGAAAEAMRRVLIDRARARGREKRGGGRTRVDIEAMDLAAPAGDEELLAVDEALEKLAAVDAEGAEIAKLRYFVGLGIPEVAAALGISERSVKRHWAYARAWLRAEIAL